MRRPIIRGALPGPKARAIIDLSDRFVSPSYTRDYPLVAERGEGCWVTDPDGNEFLDMTAGIAVCATGHCHPAVVGAISDQATRLLHMSGTDFYYAPQTHLAQRLAALGAVRGEAHRVYFGNSGAEAIECALKLARHKTQRHAFIAFIGSFHGRTMGALTLTASKVVQRGGFGPLVPGTFHSVYPDPLRDGTAASARALAQLDNILARLCPPDDVAAIVVEPIQGEGGYVVPPDEFLTGLRQRCDDIGALLVFDEVQSGMGRTGKMFAWQHSGVEPDIICLAKGIASGMPLGAVIARSEVMSWPPGSHASTFGGNPIACAAALATLDLLDAALIDNAARMGRLMKDRLESRVGNHPRVADVRGRGLMLAVELTRDRTHLTPDPALKLAMLSHCFERGLLLLGCGPSAVRFCPALCLGADEAELAVEMFGDALDATAKP